MAEDAGGARDCAVYDQSRRHLARPLWGTNVCVCVRAHVCMYVCVYVCTSLQVLPGYGITLQVRGVYVQVVVLTDVAAFSCMYVFVW